MRSLLSRPGCLTLPGVFNGLSARAVKHVGFEACYIGGSNVTAASGVPDIGVVGLEGFCSIIREVVGASALPLLIDADTGFGEEEMVTRTVLEYHAAGAAGLLWGWVQGVRVAYQRCGTSAVVMAQRGNELQLLPSKRHMAAIDETISRAGLHDMG